MFLLQSDELLEHAGDIIHKDTQLHKLSLDLTVDQVQRFDGEGALDFGGSEFRPAAAKTITPRKRNEDDDYGWWDLQQGSYKAIFNETLQNHEDTLAIVSPHQHASEAGIIASTNAVTSESVTDQLALNFQVPSAGCRIKENARFATLHILAD